MQMDKKSQTILVMHILHITPENKSMLTVDFDCIVFYSVVIKLKKYTPVV